MKRKEKKSQAVKAFWSSNFFVVFSRLEAVAKGRRRRKKKEETLFASTVAVLIMCWVSKKMTTQGTCNKYEKGEAGQKAVKDREVFCSIYMGIVTPV